MYGKKLKGVIHKMLMIKGEQVFFSLLVIHN